MYEDYTSENKSFSWSFFLAEPAVLQVFFKVSALKKFAIFIGKHLCWSLSLFLWNNRHELAWYLFTPWKVPKYGVFSGPYFLVFGLNTEIYRVIRKISVFGHFSRSAEHGIWQLYTCILLNFIFKAAVYDVPT